MSFFAMLVVLTGVGVGNASRADVSLALADSGDTDNENGAYSIEKCPEELVSFLQMQHVPETYPTYH